MVSVAVKTSAPAVVDFTVKVTTPEALLTPEARLMVGVPGPDVCAKRDRLTGHGIAERVFQGHGDGRGGGSVGGHGGGRGVTVDCAAVTGPVKVTVAV